MLTIHRPPRLLLAALTALLITAFAAGSARAAGGPPACPGHTAPTGNPQQACIVDGWVSDSYASQVQKDKISVSSHEVKKGPKGIYSYLKVTVEAGFTDPLKVCPEGGVPLQVIPCQNYTASFAITGRYVAGKSHLQDSGTVGSTYSPCPNASEVHGPWTGVMTLSVPELTQNPDNDLGDSGFQFAVHVNVPSLPKAPHKKT